MAGNLPVGPMRDTAHAATRRVQKVLKFQIVRAITLAKAFAGRDRVDQTHVDIAQLKVIDGNIFLDLTGEFRLWQGEYPMLQRPPKNHLGQWPPAALCNCLQLFQLEDPAAGKRGVALNQNIVGSTVVNDVHMHATWPELDLIDHGFDVNRRQHLVDMSWEKVADAD